MRQLGEYTAAKLQIALATTKRNKLARARELSKPANNTGRIFLFLRRIFSNEFSESRSDA
jgi:hypothetical protein